MKRAALALLVVLAVLALWPREAAPVPVVDERPVPDAPAPAAAPKRLGFLGEVLSSGDDKPIRGALVRVTLVDGTSLDALTGDDGNFLFDGLPAAVRTATFRADGFKDAVVAKDALPDVPEAFWSQRLEPVSVDDDGAERPAREAHLVVTVVDRRGRAVLAPRFTVAPRDDRRRRTFVAQARPAADDARAWLVEVMPGVSRLLVTADGFRPSAPIEVDVPSEGVAKQEVVLEESIAVHGHVVDATTGAAVKGAEVRVLGPGSFGPIVTDDDGRFTLTSVADEQLSFVVTAEGYAELNAGGLDGTRSRDQTLELSLTPRSEGVGAEVVGIGVSIGSVDDGEKIMTIYPGSPAEGALHEGDVIVEVDGEKTAGQPRRTNMARIRGPEGSTVRLVVKDARGALRDVTLERKRVTLPEG